ncbi:MAG: hypothetical protein WBZ36_21515 [Candidatus Nitrosopolaris sp.]
MSYIPLLSSKNTESEPNAEDIKKHKSKPDSRTFVQFRISLEEHETLLRIAQTAARVGSKGQQYLRLRGHH